MAALVTYDDRMPDIFQGLAYTYTASVRVSMSDPLVKAALTLKANLADADPGALQKIVTTSNIAGTGQITADGSANGTATIRFDFTAADTAGLALQGFLFDVKVKTNSGAPAEGAMGRVSVHRTATLTTL